MPSIRPLIRLGLGLGLGFGATYATVEVIDRLSYDSGDGEQVERVVGDPDFELFCSDDMGRGVLNSTGDAHGWRCVGRAGGLWTADAFDVDGVCRAQYGPGTRAYLQHDDANGWRCVTDP